jgi:hypothetical protein
MQSNIRLVTLRRSLEQAQHCIAEALSVVEHGEDLSCAEDDVFQAITLLRGKVMADLRTRKVGEDPLPLSREHLNSLKPGK